MDMVPFLLVSSDDPCFIAFVRRVTADYVVIASTVVDQACDRALEQQPDVVILDFDIEQPRSGWDTLNRLKLDPQTAEIPLLVCSTDIHILQARSAWLSANGFFWLEKPFLSLDLLAALETITVDWLAMELPLIPIIKEREYGASVSQSPTEQG